MIHRHQFKVLLVGDEPLLTECGRLLIENGHNIVAVATQDGDVKSWAREHSVVCDLDVEDPLNPMRTEHYDFLFSIANLQIIPMAVLQQPRIAAINFHDGILPSYSGVFVTSWSIINGEKEHGVTWHYMDAKADIGAIILQRKFPIEPSDTAYTLNTKCFDAGLETFKQLLVDLETGIVAAVPQQLAGRGIFRRCQRPTGCAVIDGKMSAEGIDCLVRGLDFGHRPNPLLVPKLHSRRSWVAVTAARVLGNSSSNDAGYILSAAVDWLRIATASVDIELGGFIAPDGQLCTATQALGLLGLDVGMVLGSAPKYSDLENLQLASARHEAYWVDCVTQCTPIEFPALGQVAPEARQGAVRKISIPEFTDHSAYAPDDRLSIAAAWVAFVCRLTGRYDFDIGYSSDSIRQTAGGLENLFSTVLPVHFALTADAAPSDLLHILGDSIELAESKGTFFSDLGVRRPEWPIGRRALVAQSLPVGLDLIADLAKVSSGQMPGEITLRVAGNGYAAVVCKQGPTEDYVDYIADLFADFLVALRQDWSTPIGNISLMTGTSLNGEQCGSSGPSIEYDARSGVLALIDFDAKSVAVRCDGVGHSYLEIAGRSDEIGRYLAGLGVSRGDVVGVYLDRSADMVCTLLGIWKAGGVYLPLDPGFPAERLNYMLADSGAGCVVTEERLVRKLDFGDLKVLEIDGDWTGKDCPELSDPGDVSGDLAYVLYTSGSTGKPKGVLVPQSSVVNFLTSMSSEPGLSRSDILVAVTTTSFDISVLELFLPLAVGAQVVVASRDESSDGRKLSNLLDSTGATVMQATPSTWRMILESGWAGGSDFKALCGGESFPPDLAQDLVNCCGEVWNMYGPTETTIWSTCARLEEAEGPITIGRPIANTQVHVLNDYGSLQPFGIPGELYIGGDGVTAGYLNSPKLTAKSFLPDLFRNGDGRLYRTGDSVRRRVDGTLEHLGRIDSQVKVRGFRIELGEIESLLVEHKSVLRVAVNVWEVCPGDQRLVAYLVLSPGERLATTELRKHLRSRLPDYMVPQHYVELEEIPLTPNGKVNRSNLPMPATVPDSRDNVEVPETGTEKLVAGVWSSLLGVNVVGRYDNFFELGGHSLLAVRAVAELEKATGIRIELRHIVMENLRSIAEKLQIRHAENRPKHGLGFVLRGIAGRLGVIGRGRQQK